MAKKINLFLLIILALTTCGELYASNLSINAKYYSAYKIDSLTVSLDLYESGDYVLAVINARGRSPFTSILSNGKYSIAKDSLLLADNNQGINLVFVGSPDYKYQMKLGYEFLIDVPLLYRNNIPYSAWSDECFRRTYIDGDSILTSVNRGCLNQKCKTKLENGFYESAPMIFSDISYGYSIEINDKRYIYRLNDKVLSRGRAERKKAYLFLQDDTFSSLFVLEFLDKDKIRNVSLPILTNDVFKKKK